MSIRTLRESKNWSQEHLALASGLSVRTVQRVEAGALPSHETTLVLAAALDIPVEEVAGSPALTVREWVESVSLPNLPPYQVQCTNDVLTVQRPSGPIEVLRLHLTFPPGERPCLIVERTTPSGKPRRSFFPTLTEDDIRHHAEGAPLADALLRWLSDTISSFRTLGSDDAGTGSSDPVQVTWATLEVVGEPELHAMVATDFRFGADALRFIASLRLIDHVRLRQPHSMTPPTATPS
jgi:transcriptional regulator with XRE-family HTH domain